MHANVEHILEQVAAGLMDPSVAAELLDRASGHTPPPPPPASKPLRVTCELGSLRVVGDHTVHTFDATGRFRIEEKDDATVISADPSPFGPFVRRRTLEDYSGRSGIVTVRVNPMLPIEVWSEGGQALVENMHGPILGRVELGRLRIVNFTNTVDLSVQGGKIEASGRLTSGESRIHCELGSIMVMLDPTSDVAIDARTELGRVTLPEGVRGRGRQTVTLGLGTAKLSIVNEAGRVTVTA